MKMGLRCLALLVVLSVCVIYNASAGPVSEAQATATTIKPNKEEPSQQEPVQCKKEETDAKSDEPATGSDEDEKVAADKKPKVKRQLIPLGIGTMALNVMGTLVSVLENVPIIGAFVNPMWFFTSFLIRLIALPLFG